MISLLRSTKPQVGVNVNRSHPLAPFLRSAFFLNEAGQGAVVEDRASGIMRLASVGNASVDHIGVTSDAGTKGFRATLPAALQLTWPVTIVTRVTVLNTLSAAGAVLFGAVATSTWSNPWYAYAIAVHGGSTYEIGINNGGTFTEYDTLYAPAVGETNTLVARVRSGSQEMHVDNTIRFTATNAIANPTFSTPRLCVGDTESGQSSNVKLHFGYIFSAYLPTGAVLDLIRNPYALASPMRKYWGVTMAGAAPPAIGYMLNYHR